MTHQSMRDAQLLAASSGGVLAERGPGWLRGAPMSTVTTAALGSEDTCSPS